MIPTQMNCAHMGDGWCLDCVGKLADQLARAKRNEAMCHCGSPMSAHGWGDGHSPVPAPEECPFTDPDSTPATLTAHIVAEDPRYPILCINGKFIYGLRIDPATGEIGRQRFCICHARSDGECICTLGQ